MRSTPVLCLVGFLTLAGAKAARAEAPPASPPPIRRLLSEYPVSGTEAGIDATRLLLSSGVAGLTLVAYVSYGFAEWWTTAPRPFHYTREGNLQRYSYVGGVDKFGHAWGCLVINRGVSGLLRWSGMKPLWSTLLGAALAQGIFTFAEIEDAYYDYGWSDGDVVFNLLGSLFGVVLDLVPWLDRLLDFRVWYWPTPMLARKNYNAAEDYSGQKYFLVVKGEGIPALRETGLRYLELYVGYHAEGYRRYRHRAERHVFVGFSLDVGAVIAEVLFPRLRPPEELEAWTVFLFEHWHPHVLHAPLVDAKLP
ncbi:MAG: DUF2279 domain-containing protein [Planctomycetota bacterium]|jgi:hypothetical protein